MKKVSTEKVYDNYEKGFNGRMNLSDLPEVQQKVTYPHPNKEGEMTSQNYIEYEDLAVVVFIRKGKNNEMEFGLIEKEAPAFANDEEAKGYYGILLEAPTFAFPQKNEVPENMSLWLEEQILNMGLEMKGFSALDDSKTAVCQSFTNQNARFYVAGIKESEQDIQNKMHWFPLSSLVSYLNMQRMGGEDNLHSSIQTLYPLELLYKKYKKEIQKAEQTEFKLDRELPKLIVEKSQKTNPGYRFSIWEATYKNSRNPEEVKVATCLKSRSNAGNCVLMAEDGEKMYLSPQRRSPYMIVGEDLKKEVAGGLTEGESYEETATRELVEEQGFNASSVEPLTGPLAATPLNNELSQAFLAHYEQGTETSQHLDEQEAIGKKQAKSFKDLYENIQNSELPLTTKYYIMLKAREKDENLKPSEKNGQVNASEVEERI